MSLIEGIKRGTIELLVLTLLQEKDMYGYQISQELSKRSEGLYVLQQSSLYPTLYRLVEKKLITDRKEKVGKRRTRVYYHMNEAGEQYLAEIRNEYLTVSRGVFNILNVKSLRDMEDVDNDNAK